MSPKLALVLTFVVLAANSVAGNIVALGSLETVAHGVSGIVSVDTAKNVVIIDRFNYDGMALARSALGSSLFAAVINVTCSMGQ